jgi:hypothetical protein
VTAPQRQGDARAANDWRLRIGAPLGALLLRLLALTWRVRYVGQEAWRARVVAGQGAVLALWHGQLFPLTWALRHRGVWVLVSEHRDGEIIARILERFGYTMIRGSSTRGGARALAEMVRALRSGHSIAVTPDGPRGPARVFAPGAAVAAQRSGTPVIPLYARASSAWRLRSWDQFMIPKPFARVTVYLGDATLVRGDSPTDAEAEAPRLAALIDPPGESPHG